jgi:hypothetical protein
MKQITRILSLFLLLSSLAVVARGDTGTYEILKYEVNLAPHSDGTVIVHYYLRWLVKSGEIPWITVGTAGEDYDIMDRGGAARNVSSQNQGDWSGVRIDLDHGYQSGESFDVAFTLRQRALFYADQDNYRIDFTPGWYDRAITDTLRLAITFFSSVESVRTKPDPTSIIGDTMIWNRYDLPAGDRLSVSVMIPKNIFPAGSAIAGSRKGPASSHSGTNAIRFIVIMIGLFIFIMRIIWMSRGRRYTGGRVFFGGLFGPFSGTGGGRSSSGGGGFGGRSSSCACACVSCACACACAGGGGAGCDRKQIHECPQCREGRKV